MKTKNKIDLIGFVGADPVSRQTVGGTPITQFSIATTERWKGKDDLPREHTEWHRIVFFGAPAKQLADFVRKGSLIEVEGSLRSRTYEKEGIQRVAYEVRGNEYRLLDRRPGADDLPVPPRDESPPNDSPADDDLPL